mgnify:CR=1 FL=1
MFTRSSFSLAAPAQWKAFVESLIDIILLLCCGPCLHSSCSSLSIFVVPGAPEGFSCHSDDEPNFGRTKCAELFLGNMSSFLRPSPFHLVTNNISSHIFTSSLGTCIPHIRFILGYILRTSVLDYHFKKCSTYSTYLKVFHVFKIFKKWFTHWMYVFKKCFAFHRIQEVILVCDVIEKY